MSDEKTFWNGMPTIATRGTAVVADDAQFPKYWAKEEGIVGTRIPVVCVILDSVNYGGGCTYMDNREGIGWFYLRYPALLMFLVLIFLHHLIQQD